MIIFSDNLGSEKSLNTCSGQCMCCFVILQELFDSVASGDKNVP